MRIRKTWCTLCRENFEDGDECIQCKECKKKFHRECLQAEGLIDNEILRDIKNYLCYQCMNEDDEIPENEDRCKICREKSSNLILLLCDGCPNSYHVTCLGLPAEPETEKWFCPVCKPEEHKNLDVRRMRKGFAIDNMNGDHVNSSTCYVCQRPGKLLGCDFCPNSFHPTCLPDLDFDNISDQWECPCCKNEDPLLNQGHKRWTKNEIQEIMKKRQRELTFWRSKIIKYRNRFLLAHRKDLQPFVNPRVFSNLTKTFKNDFYNSRSNHSSSSNAYGSSSGNRKVNKHNNSDRNYYSNNSRKDVDMDSKEFDEYISSLEDEANENACKFIESVFLSVYYPNGRKIERRPLVDNVHLKPHQEDGVEWLLKSFLTGGAILADEMGLGKTIQTLCFLSYLKCSKIDGPHLIVVPLSTVGNWLREIHRFTPHLTCIKICGSKNERTHAKEDRLAEKGLYDLYVTTYETVKNEEEFFVETIPKWQCIVLDEAHRIKNQSGAIRHSMDRVVGNMRLLLTGTPLQNNSAELFTLINFMFPDIFKNSEIIEQAFMNASQNNAANSSNNNGITNNNQKNNNSMKNKNSKDDKNNLNGGGSVGSGSKLNVNIGNIDLKSAIKEEDLKSIRCLLDKIMLRRLKEQAITLPRKIFHDVWLPLGTLSAHWYKRLLDIRSMVEEKVSVKKLLGLVIKMRIICGHPKGIVSRPSQMEKLFAFFEEESEEIKEQVKNDALKLKYISGEEHIESSSKLIFIDKLLCQLHYENCKYVKNYSSSFEKHKKEVAAYRYHKIQEQNNAQKKKREYSGKFKKIEALESSPLFMEILNKGKFELKPTSENEDMLKSFMHTVAIDNECPYKKKRCIYDKVRDFIKNTVANHNNKSLGRKEKFIKHHNLQYDLSHYDYRNSTGHCGGNNKNGYDENDLSNQDEDEDEDEEVEEVEEADEAGGDKNSKPKSRKKCKSDESYEEEENDEDVEVDDEEEEEEQHKRGKKIGNHDDKDNEEEEEEEEEYDDHNANGNEHHNSSVSDIVSDNDDHNSNGTDIVSGNDNISDNDDKDNHKGNMKESNNTLFDSNEEQEEEEVNEEKADEERADEERANEGDEIERRGDNNKEKDKDEESHSNGMKKEPIDRSKKIIDLGNNCKMMNIKEFFKTQKKESSGSLDKSNEHSTKVSDKGDSRKTDLEDMKKEEEDDDEEMDENLCQMSSRMGSEEKEKKDEEGSEDEAKHEEEGEAKGGPHNGVNKETNGNEGQNGDCSEKYNKKSSETRNDEKEENESENKSNKGEIKMHKVLIFTQFQLVLDELEEYCKYRCWKYMRLDGSTNKLIRELDIREFNLSDSIYFIYLISTRAGGLGINLTAANHVIMYDEDWNPFIDLQAIDRAHRIGQKREVNVWKLMTEWTVEERMAFRREQKLKLDKLVVQTQDDEDMLDNFEEKLSSDEIRKLMLHGKAAIQNMNVENTNNSSLEFFIERGRRKLPIINGVDLEKEEKTTIEEEVNNNNNALEGDSNICIRKGRGRGNVDDSEEEEEEEDDDDNNNNRRRDHDEDENGIDIDEIMMDEAEELEMRHNNSNNMNDNSPLYGDGGGSGQLYLNSSSSKSKIGLLKDNNNAESTNGSVGGGRGGATGEGHNTQNSSNGGIVGGVGTGGGSDTTLWRSVRERKKPQNMYTPEYWGRKQEVKQIKHEYRCFICNNTKNYKTIVKDRNNNDIEIDYGDMINCFRCPKTYHKLCEGIKDENVKKTWTCSWHECCLCFRKSSQCGNLLIHCATCPTSFCYNCFPPDYVRYYVGEEYYHNLRQRGVNFTPQNWVCFLCSKCKAVEEQKKRRKMTKEERENEKQLQKELRSQLHDSKQEELEAKKRKRAQQMERDKFIIENRKRIDALDQKYELQLRSAYENLFPPNFVKELMNRIEHAKSLKQKGIEDEINKEPNKKKSTTFLHTKLPNKLLVLCENCKLPCHANYKYPGQCCYPLELDKSYFYANSSFNHLSNNKDPTSPSGCSSNDKKIGTNNKDQSSSSFSSDFKERTEIKYNNDEKKFSTHVTTKGEENEGDVEKGLTLVVSTSKDMSSSNKDTNKRGLDVNPDNSLHIKNAVKSMKVKEKVAAHADVDEANDADEADDADDERERCDKQRTVLTSPSAKSSLYDGNNSFGKSSDNFVNTKMIKFERDYKEEENSINNSSSTCFAKDGRRNNKEEEKNLHDKIQSSRNVRLVDEKQEKYNVENKFNHNANENAKMMIMNTILSSDNNGNDVKGENNNENIALSGDTPNSNNDANSKGKTRRFLRAVCSKCGTVQLGKLAHFRKHCDKLTEEEKKEYEDKREKLKQLIDLLNKKNIQDEHTQEEYKNMSVFKFKSLYNNFQDRADDILEECIREMKWDMLISSKKKVPKKEKEFKRNNNSNSNINGGGNNNAGGNMDDDKNEDNQNRSYSAMSRSRPNIAQLLFRHPLIMNSNGANTKDIIEIKSDITDEMREIMNNEMSSITGKRRKCVKSNNTVKKIKRKKMNENNMEDLSNISNTQNENNNDNMKKLNYLLNPFHEKLIKDIHNANFIRDSFNDDFLLKAKEFLRVTKKKLINNSFTECAGGSSSTFTGVGNTDPLSCVDKNRKLNQSDIEKSIIQNYLNKMKNSLKNSIYLEKNTPSNDNNLMTNLGYAKSRINTSASHENKININSDMYKNTLEKGSTTKYCIFSNKGSSTITNPGIKDLASDSPSPSMKKMEKIENFNNRNIRNSNNSSSNNYSMNDFNVDIFNIDKNIKCEDIEKKLLNLCANTNLMKKKIFKPDKNEQNVERNTPQNVDARTNFHIKKNEPPCERVHSSTVDYNVDYDIKKITNSSEACGSNKVQEYILYRRKKPSNSSSDMGEKITTSTKNASGDRNNTSVDKTATITKSASNSKNIGQMKISSTITNKSNDKNRHSNNMGKSYDDCIISRSNSNKPDPQASINKMGLSNNDNILQHLNLDDVKNFLMSAERSKNDNIPPEIN
ncbi:SNF2 family N-terminal domain containing protein [Plasmodium gonderi]|uniref:SNF2 family N-terminal domain containing protein n=1 Tax=Plasmodium gonderi TaxID=77519 RepID=A0A1Y1JP12_PLAGO|nr:SNF2 family N-terminal domain containing protein [Plasmodium gonderi]GAW81784.1 SNF2 family N-terminal domain containing protein [Plasmodium gonderi]